ncbi:unnamed protein product [Adineta ricciae]|uniref:Uncharacterized protein n=1 Tax=Adineta ricciae TaxID=249248 RepID=A0A814HRA4_ADIRI|nr:unnamed protein product [Adineta ricciae]
MEWAHRIAAAVIIFWVLQDVPFFIFVDIRSNVCGIYNSFWHAYYTYVCFWFLYMAIPITIMMIFGILAYRNLRGLTSMQLQGADQQLTLIICGQISMIIITVLPTCIQNAYAQITVTANKSAEQKSLEFFIANIISFLAAIGLGCSILGYGHGSFASQIQHITGSGLYSLAIAHLNNDKQLDVIVANSAAVNGIFDVVMFYSMPYGSQPSSLVVADFSCDGKMDFRLINNGTDSLSIYLRTESPDGTLCVTPDFIYQLGEASAENCTKVNNNKQKCVGHSAVITCNHDQWTITQVCKKGTKCQQRPKSNPDAFCAPKN